MVPQHMFLPCQQLDQEILWPNSQESLNLSGLSCKKKIMRKWFAWFLMGRGAMCLPHNFQQSYSKTCFLVSNICREVFKFRAWTGLAWTWILTISGAQSDNNWPISLKTKVRLTSQWYTYSSKRLIYSNWNIPHTL